MRDIALFRLFFQRESLERALYIEFILLALVIPATDYRGGGFFVLLGLSALSPFVLALLLLVFLAILVALTVPTAFKFGSVQGIRQMFALIGIVGIAILLGDLTAGLFGPKPAWLAHSAIYHAVADALGVAAIFCAPIAAIVIPVLTFGLAVWNAVRRRLLAAAGYAAVPVLAFAACFLGSVVTDRLTVSSCDTSIQAVLRSKDHSPLSQEPNHTTTIGPHRQIAVCGLDSPLFFGEYIVDDPLDGTPDTVAKRVGLYLDGGHCSVSARRVEKYYWVDEGC